MNEDQRQNIQANYKLHYAEENDQIKNDHGQTELIGLIDLLNIEDPEPYIEPAKNPEN